MDCELLWRIFSDLGLEFFTGVPDSTYYAWMSFLEREHGKRLTNIIASNECEAVAIAIGHYLASQQIGVVYMQNAGEGKTINPLVSLSHSEIYSIPLLLMIGWRGEPGTKDEPQHSKMGKITTQLLDLLDIPSEILPNDVEAAKEIIQRLYHDAKKNNRPVALIIRRGTVTETVPSSPEPPTYSLRREEVIHTVIEHFPEDTVVISTTGKTSRELFELRVARGETPYDFYTIGGMGCAAGIAFGVAINYPTKKTLVLDGDGAVLMQMGSLATIGHYAPPNFIHLVIDNESHESTGGQPTVSPSVNFEQVALACGYKIATSVTTKTTLINSLKTCLHKPGPIMIVVKVAKGARSDLGRPTSTPIENKVAFVTHLKGDS